MTWTRLATIEEARTGRPWLAATIGGINLVVAAVDGAWYGVENLCSHAACAFSMDGELDGHAIICNCHGSEFDIRTGEVLRGPADRPIRTIPVRVADEGLEVDV